MIIYLKKDNKHLYYNDIIITMAILIQNLTATYSILQTKCELPTESTLDDVQMYETNFGVLKLKSGKFPNTKNDVHIILSIDRSGSMMDSFSKLKHCVRNMINFICKNNEHKNIYTSIIFFDHEVVSAVVKMMIHNEYTKEFALNEIDNIECRGRTDIEKAFNHADDMYMEDMDNYHIFMTDGNPTKGIKSKKGLIENMNLRMNHIIIGFDIDHDGNLLNDMAQASSGYYYYIDTIENAGMVYGEILDKILSKTYKNITITSTSTFISNTDTTIINTPTNQVEFYDKHSNTWNSDVLIDFLHSDEETYVYFRFPWDSNEFSINISNTEIYSGKNTKYSYTVLVDHDNSSIAQHMTRNLNVEKHYKRYEVLDILYRFRQYQNKNRISHSSSFSSLSPRSLEPLSFNDIDPCKVDEDTDEPDFVKQFEDKIKYLSAFMKARDLTEDTMMIDLISNLYIQKKIFVAGYQDNVGLARQIAELAERSYNVEYVENPSLNYIRQPRVLQRQRAASITSMNSTELHPPNVRLTRSISTYTTPQRTQVMNEMSQQAP